MEIDYIIVNINSLVKVFHIHIVLYIHKIWNNKTLTFLLLVYIDNCGVCAQWGWLNIFILLL